MKKIILIIVFALSLFQIRSFAQVAINETGDEPNASALLDMSGNNRGFLIPRVNLNSQTDTETINDLATNVSSAIGLLVYNTGEGNFKTKGFYYWNGEKWKAMQDESADVFNNDAYRYVPDYKSVSYIGSYGGHDRVEGIKLGNFRFRISKKAGVDIFSDHTLSKNVDIYIKYVGEKDFEQIRSKSYTQRPSSDFGYRTDHISNTSRTDFGPATGTSRNTDILQKNVWYGWGGDGSGIMTNYSNPPTDDKMITEKKQYIFTVADNNIEEMYICEFMVFGKYIYDAKVVLYVERIAMKKE
ncbi:hypothetical protein LJC11_03295 [Bacteroidales bacterium OttesenSCG-928-I21]|nr:hypothetical protein [Bacteroidales bacterium OttesenSCG-928-I21]